MRTRAAVTSGRRDRGQTLIETMVAVMLVMGFTTALLILVTNGLKTQTMTERSDRVTGLTQVIMSKARQADFATLGFYANDTPAAPTGNVTLPGLKTDAGAAITEQAVTLGPTRPAGEASFAKTVETFTDAGVAYRVRTWVTWVPNPSGKTPTAKRVTVQTQWGPEGVTLNGDCTTIATKCITQSSMRTATASDLNPVTGTAPVSTCRTGTAVICEAYIRSGRVLDGAYMVSATDTPTQVDEVDLFVRTASPATSVNATWSWKNPAGAVIRTVSVPLTAGTDRTRWTATVTPDVSGSVLTPVHKGDIRPGATDVTFTAVMGAGTVNKTVPAFWSYALAPGTVIDPGPRMITATLEASANWCSPVASGTGPVTLNVTGHSIGFTATTQVAAAQDRVSMVFTSTVGSTTKTVTVPATLVASSVAVQAPPEHDVIIGGWVDASWTVKPPATERCNNVAVSAIIYRAADQTSTPVVLQLPATTPTIPVLATPSILAVYNPATLKSDITWTTPPDATSFKYAYQVDGGAWTEVATTATTATTASIPVALGQTVGVRVMAISGWSTSGWSDTATVTREPAAPVVTVTRSGNVVTFTWAAVPGATRYALTSIVTGGSWVSAGPDQTTTTYTRTIPRGTGISLGVYAVNAAGLSVPGTAGINVPLWDAMALQNGWVNYDNGYSQARFTRSTADVIVLSGLIRWGATPVGTKIAQLPPSYAPTARLIFGQSVSGTTATRIDVDVDGSVYIQGGDPNAFGWVSLSGITFLAADAAVTRTALPLSNGWANYGGGWAPLTGAKDTLGRVHIQGLVSSGIITDGTLIAGLPAGWAPDAYLHLETGANNVQGGVSVSVSSGILAKSNTLVGYNSLQLLWYPAALAGQQSALTLGNGWVAYGGQCADGQCAPPQFAKGADGIVTLRGFIVGGTVANGTVIATLPVGYRPSGLEIFNLSSWGHYARVDVLPGGQVVVREGVAAGWLALESISFMAEQ